MAIHDAFARFTPYELSIPGRAFAEEHFPRIVEEGESRGTDLSDPGAFVMLAATGAALREIRGEEDDPGLIEQYGALLFHGFHFWRSGEPLYLLELGAARFLVESDPDVEGWNPSPPAAAGYVQLPRHLFWAHSEDDAPAEPVDGFFWMRSTGETLSVLAAMGMREDRPGLSVISLPPVPLAEAPSWAAGNNRDGSPDFEGLLPGAEYDRLYSMVTAGEILKLAARVLWYMGRFPEAAGPEVGGRRPSAPAGADVRDPRGVVDAEEGGEPQKAGEPGDRAGAGHSPEAGESADAAGPGEDAREKGPLASALAYRRVRLREDG